MLVRLGNSPEFQVSPLRSSLIILHSRFARCASRRPGFPTAIFGRSMLTELMPLFFASTRKLSPLLVRAVGVWSLTARLSDFLYLSFVFIDILALFRRIQVEKSRVESQRVKSHRCPAPGFLVWLRNSSTPQLLNSSTPRLFVFIDILALFRQIQVEKSRVESQRVKSHRCPAPGFLVWLRNSSTPRLLNSSTVCFHRHSRFVPPILQSGS